MASVTRADWLAAAPFTLALSAGFFGFFSHTGLLQVLERRRLLPERVTGVSAGALAGGLWCSGLDADALGAELSALRRADFWDPGLPLGGLLKGRKFTQKLGELLRDSGVRQIEQCGRPFAAVVHDVLARRPVALDHGPIDTAIVASCAVPLMFRPVLSGRRVLVDGGVSDRCGTTALGETSRVLLHYLPSRRRVGWGAAGQAPTSVARAQSLVLVTPDLPKVTPFRLDFGPVAQHRTREHFERWLDAPHVSAGVA